MLFTAGILASQNYLNLWLILILGFVGAVLGDSIGYSFGLKIGPKIFHKESSFWFNKDYIEKARLYYEQHGSKTIFLARFLPIVRTFAPILAGVGKMKYSKFIFYNLLGGFFWSFGFVLGGYYLGIAIPNVEKYFFPLILVIITLSFLPVISGFLKGRK